MSTTSAEDHLDLVIKECVVRPSDQQFAQQHGAQSSTHRRPRHLPARKMSRREFVIPCSIIPFSCDHQKQRAAEFKAKHWSYRILRAAQLRSSLPGSSWQGCAYGQAPPGQDGMRLSRPRRVREVHFALFLRTRAVSGKAVHRPRNVYRSLT